MTELLPVFIPYLTYTILIISSLKFYKLEVKLPSVMIGLSSALLLIQKLIIFIHSSQRDDAKNLGQYVYFEPSFVERVSYWSNPILLLIVALVFLLVTNQYKQSSTMN